MRCLHCPWSLLDLFTHLSSKNTECFVSTLGLLCGKDQDGRLLITHLILPEQDAVEAFHDFSDQSELGRTLARRNLTLYGWIHTHPRTGISMSSRDLHNHYPCQLKLEETVAIVVSPKCRDGPAYGVFTMTETGMNTIRDCTADQLLHTHPMTTAALYQDAKHCIMRDGCTIEILDLRRKMKYCHVPFEKISHEISDVSQKSELILTNASRADAEDVTSDDSEYERLFKKFERELQKEEKGKRSKGQSSVGKKHSEDATTEQLLENLDAEKMERKRVQKEAILSEIQQLEQDVLQRAVSEDQQEYHTIQATVATACKETARR